MTPSFEYVMDLFQLGITDPRRMSAEQRSNLVSFLISEMEELEFSEHLYVALEPLPLIQCYFSHYFRFRADCNGRAIASELAEGLEGSLVNSIERLFEQVEICYFEGLQEYKEMIIGASDEELHYV